MPGSRDPDRPGSLCSQTWKLGVLCSCRGSQARTQSRSGTTSPSRSRTRVRHPGQRGRAACVVLLTKPARHARSRAKRWPGSRNERQRLSLRVPGGELVTAHIARRRCERDPERPPRALARPTGRRRSLPSRPVGAGGRRFRRVKTSATRGSASAACRAFLPASVVGLRSGRSFNSVAISTDPKRTLYPVTAASPGSGNRLQPSRPDRTAAR